MPTVQIKTPVRPHINQLPIINCTARYIVSAAGRRFGKTEAHKIRAIYKMLEGKRIWWVTPTHRTGTDTWRDFLATFQYMPEVDINKSERRIVLPTRGELLMVAADSFKRGAGVDHMFVDEAAFCSDTLWQYELQPMLLTTNGGADFLSSTNGRNYFWRLFQLGRDPNEPEWTSFHYTVYDNPRIDPSEIENIKRNTPERVFAQEYLAEFLEDGGAVFRNLQACLVEPADKAQGRVVFGVDLGRHNDYTVIYVMDAQTRRVLAWDRFTEIGWDIQRTRIEALARKWKPSTIWMEENFNDSFVEQLQGAGWPVRAFRTTNASKQQIINELALAFEQADIGIPDEPVLLGELQAYTLERLPGGTFRYGAPDGLHDDCVMALALAWHGITNTSTLLIVG